MNVMGEIIIKEWNMFQKVNQMSSCSRASCQENPAGFVVNRMAQFLTWSPEMLESYNRDLEQALADGRNLMTEKYARMMRDTDPATYAAFSDLLPNVDTVSVMLVERIVSICDIWQREFMDRYPKTARGSRPMSSSRDESVATGFRTYLRNELYTYSMNTLTLYEAWCEKLQREGQNMTIMNLEYVARMYGFSSLQEMEDKAN